MKPRLAAFPKCYMDELCVHRTMTVFEWIELAATLGVDGLEFYSGFLEDDATFLKMVSKAALEKHDLAVPMLWLLSRLHSARSSSIAGRDRARKADD